MIVQQPLIYVARITLHLCTTLGDNSFSSHTSLDNVTRQTRTNARTLISEVSNMCISIEKAPAAKANQFPRRRPLLATPPPLLPRLDWVVRARVLRPVGELPASPSPSSSLSSFAPSLSSSSLSSFSSSDSASPSSSSELCWRVSTATWRREDRVPRLGGRPRPGFRPRGGAGDERGSNPTGS